MTSQSFSPVIVFAIDALITGKKLAWEDYLKVGQCHLPQIVFEEIDYLRANATDPEQEKTAKEFTRFWTSSGWHLTAAYADVPNLAIPTEAQDSKQVRINLETIKSACGLAEELPDNIIVFVSNSQPLLQKIKELGVSNLCGITAQMLLNWARMKERPVPVTKQLQTLMELRKQRQSGKKKTGKSPETEIQFSTKIQAEPKDKSTSKNQAKASPPTNKSQSTPKPTNSKSSSSSSHSKKSSNYQRPKSQRELDKELEEMESSRAKRQIEFNRKMSQQKVPVNQTSWFMNIFNGLIALVFFTAAITVAWSVLHPPSFNQFLQKQVMPVLPKEVKKLLKK